MEFFGTKQNGKQHFHPAVAEQRRRAWDKIKEGQTFKTSLIVPRENKTWEQVKTIWSMTIAMTLLHCEDRGYGIDYIYDIPTPEGEDLPIYVKIAPNQLKEYLYATCPTYNDSGERVTLSKMDIEQASQFFDNSRGIIERKFDLSIPEPRKDWRQLK